MANFTIGPTDEFQGTVEVPGDKSISHRALIFSSMAQGQSEIRGLPNSTDVQSTKACLEHLGVRFETKEKYLICHGIPSGGFKKPAHPLDCGNSGTTLRLLMGILAGQPFSSRLIGDKSLSKRPMKRICTPLLDMGASITCTNDDYAPIDITGRPLTGIEYELPIASAQLKTSLLLSGLFATGNTVLHGKTNSRDHTERMLPQYGISLHCTKDKIALAPRQSLTATNMNIPGDISSASFLIAAATLIPNATLEIKNVSLNPTRTGFLKLLKQMGASIQTEITQKDPEPIGTITVKHTPLHSTEIPESDIPSLIDELPILAVVAMFAEGTTTIRGAEELRFKESDRIQAIESNINAMGGHIRITQDGFEISGPQSLSGAAHINPYGDHRIAMAFSIAALLATNPTTIDHADCVDVSYPSFFNTLRGLTNGKCSS